MDQQTVTNIGGVIIPSASPVFLSVVALHVLAGLAATVTGAVTMLSRKGPGRHPAWGRAYFWCLGANVALATALAATRWSADYALAVLGWAALAAALIGRLAVRRRAAEWAAGHIGGMGGSYVLMLTAFYVDNGRFLPLWRDLPPAVYWLGPACVGAPIIALAARRHRPTRRRPASRHGRA